MLAIRRDACSRGLERPWARLSRRESPARAPLRVSLSVVSELRLATVARCRVGRARADCGLRGAAVARPCAWAWRAVPVTRTR